MHAHLNQPTFKGKPSVFVVEIDDPPSLAMSARSDEEILNHYRRVRDEIRHVVEHLPESLWDAEHHEPDR